MKVNTQVRFLDLVDLETKAHDGLVNVVNRLESLKRPRVAAEQQQLQLYRSILAVVDNKGSSEVCDPLFVATRQLLNDKSLVSPKLKTESSGRLEFPGTQTSRTSKATTDSDDSIKLTALVLGILAVDGAAPPPVRVVLKGSKAQPATVKVVETIDGKDEVVQDGVAAADATIVADAQNPLMLEFTKAFYAAVGEVNGYGALATHVLAQLCVEGDPDGRGGATPSVVTTEFVKVMRGLKDRKIQADEPQLRRRVNEELNTAQNIGNQDSIADLGIDLPDLEDLEDANIVADNVRVMGPMIVAAMFDELKVFQVVDNIVEQFQHGTLPIGPGNAGKLLYKYWRETPNRISETERKNFAAITLGIPGGDPNVAVNREFNDLWIRFVSAVSAFVRQSQVDALLRASVPNPINHQQVRKAARDLASNLSLHGYGMAHYAAREIQSQVQFMINLLQDPEIRGCHGAKDMWQVIDQVATYNLGGAKTSTRYRTLATCGTIITAWLSDHVVQINKATGPLLDIDQISNPDVASTHKATLHPTDYDLVNACELWLATTAVSEEQQMQLAEPRQTPQMTSKPVPMPSMAREMLDGIGDLGGSVGLGAGQAVPAGYGKGQAPSFYSNRRH